MFALMRPLLFVLCLGLAACSKNTTPPTTLAPVQPVPKKAEPVSLQPSLDAAHEVERGHARITDTTTRVDRANRDLRTEIAKLRAKGTANAEELDGLQTLLDAANEFIEELKARMTDQAQRITSLTLELRDALVRATKLEESFDYARDALLVANENLERYHAASNAQHDAAQDLVRAEAAALTKYSFFLKLSLVLGSIIVLYVVGRLLKLNPSTAPYLFWLP